MKWSKRGSFTKLSEMVTKNTGMSEKELKKGSGKSTTIPNLHEAALYIKKKIAETDFVTIMADYDADGITSAYILYTTLCLYCKDNGLSPRIRVRFPKRFSEGYGLSMNVVDETDHGLLITVDNGIAAVEQIKAAKGKGLDVVIIDHHQPRADGKIPEADIVVDPHVNPNGEFKDLCAAGLARLLEDELLSGLAETDAYTQSMLDIMAGIGTVADVMPLIHDNREFVKKAIDLLNKGMGTTGLRMIVERLNLGHISSDSFGFYIGPVFNAAGRLLDDGPMLVFEVLYTDVHVYDNDREAKLQRLEEKVANLIRLNNRRKEKAKEFQESAEEMIEPDKHKAFVIYSEKFNEGLNGIVAGHLAEKYHRPVFVFSDKEGDETIVKGSGRNGDACDIKALLDSLPDDIFAGYGGHAGAAGLSVYKEKLGELQNELDKALKDLDIEEDGGILFYDLEIKADEAKDVIEEMKKYAPFGEHNPEPVFKVADFSVLPQNGAFYRMMGADNSHIKLFGEIDALGFGMADRYINDGSPKELNLLGRLSVNYYNGTEYPQIRLEDYEKKEEGHTDTFISLHDLLKF